MLLLLILTTLLFENYGQDLELPKDETTGKICYEKIINVDGISKSELFDRAMIGVAKIFNSGKSVIDYSDKESGRIVLKPLKTAHVKSMGIIYDVGKWRYTLILIMKNGKYKYSITDFIEESTSQNFPSFGAAENEEVSGSLFGPTRKQIRYAKEELHAYMIDLQMKIQRAMYTKIDNDF